MKVTIADHSGFCFGVERAIKLVDSAVKSQTMEVVTYGPLIHNPQVVKELESFGVYCKEDLSEINSHNIAVIRTHGIERQKVDLLKKRTQHIIDATCPFVTKAQTAVYKLSEGGRPVIVVGESNHPEVQGIVSYAQGECYVISSVEEAEKLIYEESYGVVAQTTQNETAYKNILEILKNKCGKLDIVYTICSATSNRQGAALKLAAESDVMIIVGGRNSANTTRLYQICADICPRCYHIETVDDLHSYMYADAERIGISAGASTPIKLVREVKEYILERANE